MQDLGRVGFQPDGVSTGGAMDVFAISVANLLVGNREDAAALEVTLKGPILEFEHDALIAICGADLSPSIADTELPGWQAIHVKRGAVLKFGRRVWGCRAYLAIAGGINVPQVLGSRSTYVRAGIGGHHGLPLRRADVLRVLQMPHWGTRGITKTLGCVTPLPFKVANVHGSVDFDDLYGPRPVRFVRGPHFELLDSANRKLFTSGEFVVTPQSDRMGYRLGGPILKPAKVADIVSTGVVVGTVQLPPRGHPIVLMAECPTTGGYPIVGVVASADLPLVAQRCPGDRIRFSETSVERAQHAARERKHALKRLMDEVGCDVPD